MNLEPTLLWDYGWSRYFSFLYLLPLSFQCMKKLFFVCNRCAKIFGQKPISSALDLPLEQLTPAFACGNFSASMYWLWPSVPRSSRWVRFNSICSSKFTSCKRKLQRLQVRLSHKKYTRPTTNHIWCKNTEWFCKSGGIWVDPAQGMDRQMRWVWNREKWSKRKAHLGWPSQLDWSLANSSVSAASRQG